MVRIYPKPLEIGDEEGFTPEKDLFKRSSLGNGMSHLVATVEDPLVIAFDGPWGSGKTTFLKMWAGELRKAGHPVIFFDAFENDYVDDAFAALAREIVDLAERSEAPGSKVARGFRERAVDLGAVLLKGSAKLGLKVAVRAATAGLADATELGDLTNDVEKEAEDAAAAYMDQMLDRPRRQKETADRFKRALGVLPGLLSPSGAGERQKPLIFIIDELDRCKPHFALALLERIKHFMSVPNVHFVLGVHMRQLQSSVRYAYGSDIEAISYLQKFISLTVHNVDYVKKEKYADLEKYAKHLSAELSLKNGREGSVVDAIPTIVRLTHYEDMSFRTIERAFLALSLATKITPSTFIQLGAVMGGLIMMKLLRADLFLKAKRGELSLDEAAEFLRFAPDDYAPGSTSWEQNCWTYLLTENLTSELQDVGRSIGLNYRFRERVDILTFSANEVIDRLLPS